MIDNYYKTAIYQHIKGEKEEIAKHIEKMLSKVNGIKVRKVANPMQSLRFEQDILSMQRRVKTMANNFENTKIQLGVEMNLKPGTDYNVKAPDFDKLEFQMPSMPIDMIIKKAMEQNPDIGINIYKSLIEEKNLSKSLMRIFPNVTGNLSQSGQFLNEYIKNNTWTSMGMDLSFGLLKILSMPKMKKQLQYYEKNNRGKGNGNGDCNNCKG